MNQLQCKIGEIAQEIVRDICASIISFIRDAGNNDSQIGYMGKLNCLWFLEEGFCIWCYNLNWLWCGHQIHISLPYAKLLGLGLDPVVMPWFQELLFKD